MRRDLSSAVYEAFQPHIVASKRARGLVRRRSLGVEPSPISLYIALPRVPILVRNPILMHMNTPISLIILLILAVTSQGQPRNAKTNHIKRQWLDVAYASKSSAQKLDIYLPDSGTGHFPVIVSIHGGAFMGGDKADGQLTPMLEGINRGYAVVSVNYRLSMESIFPAQIQDVKAAIRWIRANAEEYEFNPWKISVWGSSAGGYLAALAGTSGGVAELEDSSLGRMDQSSVVQAVIDWYGPIDFLSMDSQFKKSGKGKANHNDPYSPESKLMGAPIASIPDQVEVANPEYYLTKDDPPIFIEHGTEDEVVPVQQSEDFAIEALEHLGSDRVTLHLLQGAGHGGMKFFDEANVNHVFEFLDKHLKHGYGSPR
jgi:acetyl esterase/lipase